MWISTNYGFFSVVKNTTKNSPREFTLRSRARKHLEDTGIFEEIVELDECDYAYRMYVSKHQLSDWLLSVVDHINYDNFKDSVRDENLKKFYNEVWLDGWVILGNSDEN